MTVNADTHRVLQSPKVAKPYRVMSVGPLVNIDKSINVTIQSREDFERNDPRSGSHFTSADVPDIEFYENVAVNGVPEEHEETVSVAHGIMLSPIAGPYDGGENGYTFQCGENTYRRVQMHDLEFRMKLESGKVRFMNKDLLRVDLQTTQSVTKSGKISNSHMVLNVIEYKPYEPPDQTTIDDYLEE